MDRTGLTATGPVAPGDPGRSVVRAAGGVVWRRTPGGAVEVVVVHRPRYDDWSLPKGKAEPGEQDRETALREVAEETGLDAELGSELTRIAYVDHRGRDKEVRYWAMTVPGDAPMTFVPNDEVDQLVWLTVEDARSRLSYERDRGVLDALRLVTERS